MYSFTPKSILCVCSDPTGKTYTIQGTRDQPGIVPRALDVLFNTVGSRLVGEGEGTEDAFVPTFRPVGWQGVAEMRAEDVERLNKDRQTIIALGCELVQVRPLTQFFF